MTEPGSPPPMPPWLPALLACPVDHGPLRHDEQAERLTCASCGAGYRVERGIPVLLAGGNAER